MTDASEMAEFFDQWPETVSAGGTPDRPWVCYCGKVAPWSWSFPHWDCQGGRPLSPEEIAARKGGS